MDVENVRKIRANTRFRAPHRLRIEERSSSGARDLPPLGLTKSDHMVVISLLTSVSVTTEKPSYNASSFCLVEPFEKCA
jgi:hypothetical protein